MLRRYGQYSSPEGDSFTISGLGAVAVYGGVGLLLTIAAWLLYRRRKMETATDTVAIPVLKPVFKYCMAYGCGVLLAAFVHDALPGNAPLGLSAALITALAVLVGSLIGYFAAEMLIRKTVWVFRGSWKGWLIFAAAAVLIIGACEADLFGWEKSQPKAERITAVQINDTEYTEPDSIRRILELQRSVVEHKKQHETPDAERYGVGLVSGGFDLRYVLDNGRVVTRSYQIRATEAEALDPESDIAKLQTVLNLPEALRWRSVCKVQVVPENIVLFQADFDSYVAESDSFEHSSVRFSAAEAVDFYQNALLADLAENKVGRRILVESLSPHITSVSIQLEVMDSAAQASSAYLNSEQRSWYYINLYEDNTHCLEWLREHCDEEIQVLRGGSWVKCGTAG
jgi:ABC-2 type transport system permease protein